MLGSSSEDPKQNTSIVLAVFSPSGRHAIMHGAVEKVTTIGRLSYLAVQICKRSTSQLFCSKFGVKAGALQLDTFAHLLPDCLLFAFPGGLVVDHVSRALTPTSSDFNPFTKLSGICLQLIIVTKALTAARRKGGNDSPFDE